MGDVVGSRAELEHLLDRARALISNAGDGNWNRESAEWQLAATELLRDMDGRTAPDPFVLEPDLSPEAAVMRTLGAASTCWTAIRNAGVFDSVQAQRIGEELLRWLRDREQVPRSSWPETDPEVTQAIDAAAIVASEEPPPVVTSGVLMTPTGDGRYDVSDVRHYGPGGRVVTEPTGGPRVEISLQGVKAYDVDGNQVPPLTQEQQEAALDPDGDLEGYDGPIGRPGGYCFGPDGTGERSGSHLVGADRDCPRCGGWYTPEQERRNAELEAGRELDS